MALQSLYLFKWNNYRNKLVKGRPQTSQGIQYNVNGNSQLKFNPNDGISAECILNINYNSFNYDYILESENNVIIRSWFIKEVIRLQVNQVKCILVRDIITDYLTTVLNNELMVHRGICSESNSAIYNKEGFELNKIKTSETLLKDASNTAWIVGYVPLNVNVPTGQNTFGTLEEIPNATAISSESEIPIYESSGELSVFNSMSLYTYYEKYDQTSLGITNRVTYEVLFCGTGTAVKEKPAYMTSAGQCGSTASDLNNISSMLVSRSNNNYWKEILWNNFTQVSSTLYSINTINQYADKIYYNTTNHKYYKVKLTYDRTVQENNYRLSGQTINETIYNHCTSITSDLYGMTTPAFRSNLNYGDVTLTLDIYKYELEEITQTSTYHIDITQVNNENIKVDGQPYKMFVMPLDTTKVNFAFKINPTDAITYHTNDLEIQNAFLSWFTKDNSRILDLQILPYFPIPNIIGTYNSKPVINADTTPRIDILDENDNIVSSAFWIQKDSFSVIIENERVIENYKLENECDSYRLCSPHYESIFEFNAVQMKGWTSILAECTYKPYQPYIHLVPNFNPNSLYGNKYGDSRGLVSTCNYALSIASDEWATYARQNSTYQLIFDREIQNLEVKQDAQRLREGLTAGSGLLATLGAALTGKAGAAVGAGTATLGSMINSYINDTITRPEELNFKRDIFKYNIANIKAQPQTLTKVSGIDINNRLFPVLEFYTCTEDEKSYFERYLYFNSYSIERIGKIKDYIKTSQDYTYIEAEIIRFDDNIDSHELDYLNNVLSTGVYFAGGLANEQ